MAIRIEPWEVLVILRRTILLLAISLLLAGAAGGYVWYSRYRPSRFLDIPDQTVRSRVLNFRRITLPKPGFVLVRIHREYPPTERIFAHSGFLDSGTHREKMLTFFREDWLGERAPAEMIAMAYTDVDGDGVFTEFDSEPMRDEYGRTIERVFRLTVGTPGDTLRCEEGLHEEFEGPDLDPGLWDQLFVTVPEQGELIQTVQYGSWNRLPTKHVIAGDFDIRAEYSSFVFAGEPPAGAASMARLIVFSGAYEVALGVEWHLTDTGSVLLGVINGQPAETRVDVPSGASAMLRLRRTGTAGDVIARVGETETVLAHTDDVMTDPVYVALTAEDTDGSVDQVRAAISSVDLTCP